MSERVPPTHEGGGASPPDVVGQAAPAPLEGEGDLAASSRASKPTLKEGPGAAPSPLAAIPARANTSATVSSPWSVHT